MVYGKSPPSRPVTPEPPMGTTGACVAVVTGLRDGAVVSAGFFSERPNGDGGAVFFGSGFTSAFGAGLIFGVVAGVSPAGRAGATTGGTFTNLMSYPLGACGGGWMWWGMVAVG